MQHDRPWYVPSPWQHPSAEHLLAKLEAIIASFRKAYSDNANAEYRQTLRDTAIKEIRELIKLPAAGFTEADAHRWLDGAVRRKPGRR